MVVVQVVVVRAVVATVAVVNVGVLLFIYVLSVSA